MVTVMVVEDNPMNMELTVDLLQSDGYDVLQAEDGPMALDLLKENKVDLILLDIQLPVMDGLELLDKLKKSSKLKTIPVIALTAYSMRGDKDKFINAGCSGYISKPIDISEFRNAVASYVNNK